ncbi:MAG: Rab family GTPase [Anaerolineales bacterium]|nr:Rab family GTPase [Anaerolineales bacterium]
MSTIPVLKVVVAGDGNVGKTSLIRRYCEGRFEQSRVATIGVDFQTQRVELPDGPIKLSIWDMAGQERFEVMREGFYRGSLAAALVYDLAEPESLRHLPKWRKEILAVVEQVPLLVVGNKRDLAPDAPLHEGKTFADDIGGKHLVTSALTGEGVDRLFKGLAYLAAQRSRRK